jgi:hypothetical protein
MSTDLRAALRDAVSTAPDDRSDPFDMRALLTLGSERVRRRNVRIATAATSVLAAAAVAVAFLLLPPPGRRESEPVPADVVHVDFKDAKQLDLEVLTSRRTFGGPGSQVSYDRYEGLTTDGLVLRTRYTHTEDSYRYGLVDPTTGRTEWLPRPPLGLSGAYVAALTAARLVFYDRHYRVLLDFDRAARTWTRLVISEPAGIEVHAAPLLQLGPDGRLYLGSSMENDYPMHWWSYPLDAGGAPRPEPDFDGLNVLWTPNGRVTANVRGRVVRIKAGVSRTMSEHRPTSCPVGKYPFVPWLRVAGDRPVVTYFCDEKHDPQNVTVVLGENGQPNVEAVGVVQAADGDHVLLGAAGGTYLLDLRTNAVSRIGAPVQSGAIDDPRDALSSGLALWSNPGPTETAQQYDVVWKVARLP